MTKELDLFSIGSWTIFDHIFRMSRYPGPGDTVTLDMPIEQLDRTYFGDCSANVAAVVAKLGLDVGLGMVVGEDFVESGYQQHLEDLGVDLSGTEIVPGAESGHSYLYSDENGDGFCLSHLGVAQDQTTWSVPEDSIRTARAVVISEKFSSYTLAAIRLSKATGAITAINGMVGSAGNDAKKFLRHADILFIAESELAVLLSALDLKQPQDLHRQGPSLIYVTLGARGSCVFQGGKSEDIGLVTVAQVVDATGAGDAYAGGTMAALLNGWQPVAAGGFGAAVASFVVEKWGCQTNLPDWTAAFKRFQQANAKEST